MPTFLMILHSLVCICLIGLILLQSGKGAQAGATFGNGANGSFGGVTPATFFVKLTAFVAFLYFVTCMSLGIFKGESDSTRFLKHVEESSAVAGLQQDSVDPSAKEKAPDQHVDLNQIAKTMPANILDKGKK